MNNFNKIKSMSLEEFVEWLDEHGQFDGSQHMEWFNSQYCQKCEPLIGTIVGEDREIEFAYCELEHKCRYFPELDEAPDNKKIIELWLQEEVE